MLLGRQIKVPLPRLDRGGRTRGLGSMFVFGVSYAIASISCTLPVFLAQVSSTLGQRPRPGHPRVRRVRGRAWRSCWSPSRCRSPWPAPRSSTPCGGAWPMIGRVAGGFLVVAGGYLAWYGVYEIRDSVELRSGHRPGDRLVGRPRPGARRPGLHDRRGARWSRSWWRDRGLRALGEARRGARAAPRRRGRAWPGRCPRSATARPCDAGRFTAMAARVAFDSTT